MSFYVKARTAFEAGDHATCIGAVDGMFMPEPEGYGDSALDTDAGNGAALYKARALLKKQFPDHRGAMRECQRVIERGLGEWPESARRLAAEARTETRPSPW
jgi:hypothetical protein